MLRKRDITYRVGIEKAYGNAAMREEQALATLMTDTLEQEVARRLGLAPTPQELRALSQHAEKTSKAPQILAAVKQVFGKDTAAYARLYLAPRIVNAKLHAHFSRDKRIHAAERRRIEQAFGLVRAGKSFVEAAKASGGQIMTLTNPAARPELPPPQLRGALPEGATPDPLAATVSKMQVGAVFPNIVEDDTAYRILRLVSRMGKNYRLETLVCPKSAFDGWYLAQAKAVRVEVRDTPLKRALRQHYAGLWWVSRLR